MHAHSLRTHCQISTDWSPFVAQVRCLGKPKKLVIFASRVKLQSDGGKTEAKVEFSADFGAAVHSGAAFSVSGFPAEVTAETPIERDRAVLAVRQQSAKFVAEGGGRGFFG